MKKASLSIFVFGIYLTLAGLSFITVPNWILPLLTLAPTQEVWIRIVGLLTFILGFYFFYAVRFQVIPFFKATVIARFIFFTGVTSFALLNLGPKILILFGLVDFSGAIWTIIALKMDAKK